MSSNANDKYIVEAVSRALDLLDTFRQSEELTLAEIKLRVGLNKSRVFRLLHTLVEHGYIEKTEDGSRYLLGVKLLERAACVRKDLRLLAQPWMRRLHEKFNETINLGLLDKGQILYIEMLESSRPIRMAETVGGRSPLHSTALGKTILAYLSEGEAEKLLSNGSLLKFTERTIIDTAKLKSELRTVRNQGFAFDDRENDLEGFCIGAPIFDSSARPIAALSVSGPYDRVRALSKEIAEDLVKGCSEISRKLGYRKKVSPGKADY